VEHRQVEMRQTTAYRSSGDDPARFLQELRQLRDGAGLGPAELAARAHYPYDRIRAAEAGPSLPDLPVLSAYVRGCGGTTEEWEERWRSLTSAQTLPLLAARPAGSSTAASAGARIGSTSPVADTPDPSIILAALDRVAEEMAVGNPSSIPSVPSAPSAASASAASASSAPSDPPVPSAALPSRSGAPTIGQRPGGAPGAPGAPGSAGAKPGAGKQGSGKTAAAVASASGVGSSSRATPAAGKPTVWETRTTRTAWDSAAASTSWGADQAAADAEPVTSAAGVTEAKAIEAEANVAEATVAEAIDAGATDAGATVAAAPAADPGVTSTRPPADPPTVSGLASAKPASSTPAVADEHAGQGDATASIAVVICVLVVALVIFA
jgi:hypothetical protein